MYADGDPQETQRRGKKPMTRVKRGARAVAAAGERAIAEARDKGPPTDEYGELGEVLKEGRASANALGHQLGHWKRRPYAPNTAADATCMECSAMAMVNLEIRSSAHGPAITTQCSSKAATTPRRDG